MIGALRWITYINVSWVVISKKNTILTRIYSPFDMGIYQSTVFLFLSLTLLRFEALITNEFRTLKGTCVTLVPQGPGYENVSLSNQVCTAVGSLPGEPFVDGARFTELSYGFSYSHTWMVRIVSNFSINMPVKHFM